MMKSFWILLLILLMIMILEVGASNKNPEYVHIITGTPFNHQIKHSSESIEIGDIACPNARKYANIYMIKEPTKTDELCCGKDLEKLQSEKQTFKYLGPARHFTSNVQEYGILSRINSSTKLYENERFQDQDSNHLLCLATVKDQAALFNITLGNEVANYKWYKSGNYEGLNQKSYKLTDQIEYTHISCGNKYDQDFIKEVQKQEGAIKNHYKIEKKVLVEYQLTWSDTGNHLKNYKEELKELMIPILDISGDLIKNITFDSSERFTTVTYHFVDDESIKNLLIEPFKPIVQDYLNEKLSKVDKGKLDVELNLSCDMCMEAKPNVMFKKCSHVWCENCIAECIKRIKIPLIKCQCPTCKENSEMSIQELLEIKKENELKNKEQKKLKSAFDDLVERKKKPKEENERIKQEEDRRIRETEEEQKQKSKLSINHIPFYHKFDNNHTIEKNQSQENILNPPEGNENQFLEQYKNKNRLIDWENQKESKNIIESNEQKEIIEEQHKIMKEIWKQRERERENALNIFASLSEQEQKQIDDELKSYVYLKEIEKEEEEVRRKDYLKTVVYLNEPILKDNYWIEDLEQLQKIKEQEEIQLQKAIRMSNEEQNK